MNHYLKPILLTAICLSAIILEACKLEMHIPDSDAEYKIYATTYLTMTSLSFVILSSVIFFITELNWIKALMIVMFVMHAYFILKQKLGYAGVHCKYDWFAVAIAVFLIGLMLFAKKKKR